MVSVSAAIYAPSRQASRASCSGGGAEVGRAWIVVLDTADTGAFTCGARIVVGAGVIVFAVSMIQASDADLIVWVADSSRAMFVGQALHASEDLGDAKPFAAIKI